MVRKGKRGERGRKSRGREGESCAMAVRGMDAPALVA